MNPQSRPRSVQDPFRSPALRLQAFQTIRDRSFFRRRIKLVSGRESDFYFDLKPTMFSPQGSACLAELLLQELRDTPVDYVGGLALGAVPLISTLTMLSHVQGRPIAGFFVRKEVKDHGTKRLVEGLAAEETLRGKRVVILDDVTTTGGSAMVAVRAAQDAGAAVVLVLSIVDREEGADASYREAGIAFRSLFKASEFLAG